MPLSDDFCEKSYCTFSVIYVLAGRIVVNKVVIRIIVIIDYEAIITTDRLVEVVF